MNRETLADQMSRENFGSAVRALRERRGLTQLDLARVSAITPTSVSRIELGQRAPNIQTLVQLADALGIRFSVAAGGVQIEDEGKP